MGFLTEDEVGSLRITNMILHVVGTDEFVAEPARAVEHEAFFIDRIRDTDAAAVYGFKPASNVKSQLERMASGADGFEPGAQALSHDFSRLHVAASIEGAFFIFELETDDTRIKIYSFIKYDYSEAIEQADSDHGSLLRRIVHAFIADRKAIQKSALVRVVAGVAQDAVSARDRAKLPPDIGDYFERFLDVMRSRSDRELNQAVAEAVRKTLTACQDKLPDRDVSRAVQHAKGVLRDRQQITEEAITEAILAAAGNPDDEAVRTDLQAKTRRQIRTAKLEGLAFRPDPQILRRPSMRKLKTTEGVTVIYPDAAEGAVVSRAQTPGGGEIITIRTERVTEDRLVGDNTRGVA